MVGLRQTSNAPASRALDTKAEGLEMYGRCNGYEYKGVGNWDLLK